MIVLFGLKNCDGCRKALRALEGEGLAVRFHDLRADGLNADMLGRWIDAVGWEALVNRRSATWRRLNDGDKAALDAEGARSLMLAHPTLIKRPILDAEGRIAVGFGDTARQLAWGAKGAAA